MDWYYIIGGVILTLFCGGGAIVTLVKAIADSRAAKTARKHELADRAESKADRYQKLDDKVEEYNTKINNRVTVAEEAIAGLRSDIRYGLDNLDNKLNDALGHVKQGNDALFAQSINSLDYRCDTYLSRHHVSASELRNLYRELESCKHILGVVNVDDDPDIQYISSQIKKVSDLSGGKEIL